MKGNITISKTNTGDDRYISVVIKDSKSRLLIVEASISLKDFADAITGMSETEVHLRYVPDEIRAQKFGKKRVTKRVYCDKVSHNKDEQTDAVVEHFVQNFGGTDWTIWDSGSATQQPEEQHKYIIVKYVDEEEITDD